MAQLRDTDVNDNLTASGISDLMPIGGMLIWWTDDIPTSFIKCDGSAISRGTYSALFTIIGTTYGVGDGSTTFNIPNLVGKHILGRNAQTLGDTGGSFSHIHSVSSNHSHTINHTHTMTHTHNLNNHVHTLNNHTHTIATHYHSIPSHNHNVNHSHGGTTGGPTTTQNWRGGSAVYVPSTSHVHGIAPSASSSNTSGNWNGNSGSTGGTTGSNNGNTGGNNSAMATYSSSSDANNTGMSVNGSGDTGANDAPGLAGYFIMRCA